MRILIDIGHPAHVHYFRNFINIMTSKGHKVFITARNKEMTFELLNNYKFTYFSRGKGGKSLFKKLIYIPLAVSMILRQALKFKPDLFLSFGSTYAAQTSKILGKPHIALDDTEHAKIELLLYPPFTDAILNPAVFTKDMGEKQIRFNSLMELSYLHPNYFKPNKEIFKLLKIEDNQPYVILRFVSWNASHDIGQKGLSLQDKFKLVDDLVKKGIKVFISSESELPSELKQYQFRIKPELFHDALFFAKLYIGEGGTTASEAVVLGTPAIYVNTLKMGYITEEINAGLLFQTTDITEIIKLMKDYLEDQNSINDFQKLHKEYINKKIDLTAFLVWFVENYPESKNIIKDKPEFQYNFR